MRALKWLSITWPMKGRAIAVLGISAVLLLAGCSDEQDDAKAEPEPTAAAERDETFKANVGVFAVDVLGLTDEALGNEAEDRCHALGGPFEGLGMGTPVTVRDDADRIVGGGHLENVRLLRDPATCMFHAEVEVDSGSEFYYVQVLDWQSEPVRAEEAAESGFTLRPRP